MICQRAAHSDRYRVQEDLRYGNTRAYRGRWRKSPEDGELCEFEKNGGGTPQRDQPERLQLKHAQQQNEWAWDAWKTLGGKRAQRRNKQRKEARDRGQRTREM